MPLRPALALAALACICAPVPGASAQDGGELSPRLAELSRPALVAAPPARRARALDVAVDGPGSLLRARGGYLAEVRFERGAAAGAEALRAAGARIIHVSARYQTVTVAAGPGELPGIAAAPRVAGVTEVLEPMVSAECGSVISEGDKLLNAFAARSDFAVDGDGVTVGILSDSFDRDPTAATHASGDIASGDLPGPGNPCGRADPVEVLNDPLASSQASDEGRAMAQIVHDLAPGAGLSFASAFIGEIGFAESIEALAEEGADVLVDDVAYFDEPFFQDGPVAVAISNVVAAGRPYFAAAGNDNLIVGGDDVASWEAPEFREASGCPPLLEVVSPVERCLDFSPGGAGDDNTFTIKVAGEETLTVDLQWDDPWNGVTSDIDVYLLDMAVLPLSGDGGTSDNVGGSQQPVEVLQWENLSSEAKQVQLVVDLCFSSEAEAEKEEGCNPNPLIDRDAKPRVKFLLIQGVGGVTATEYPKSAGGDVVGPTVYGHAGAPAAIATAAVNATSGKLETYSSRGPVIHYFGPVTGAGAAPPIAPAAIAKPDLAATDCNRTSFFVPTVPPTPGLFRFCGTSAAAPHAAGVAALILEANPDLSPGQVRAALQATARPVPGFGPTGVGAGLIDAHAALGGSALPPEIEITQEPEPVSRNRSPAIAFEANRPVSFTCSVDGGAFFACASPYVPVEPFEDGLHGYAVRGTDLAGRAGTSETVLFRVDTLAPRTSIRPHPRKVIRTRKRRARVSFGFRSSEPGSRFTCRVDGGLFRNCAETITRRFGLGRHAIRARAADEAGNADPTPAVFRFTVRRVGRPGGR